ncbi:MAG: serine protease [Coxiella sp. RIFCSPHIGHO2_12_FULL_42_15]|nr:MAG: serine protease [Coxiella sp. RIFCSPHIGHO2_12_FULL_42_15]
MLGWRRIFARCAWILALCLCVLLSLFAQKKPVSIAAQLSIHGGIGPATADFVHRSFAKAHELRAKLIILQVDTPGGLSKSMRDIVQDILSASIPVIVYVAPSGARAASAGTYILYAATVAAMAPGTNLGAATPISMGNPIMPTEKDEEKSKNQKTKSSETSEQKAINDARAYLRSLAQFRRRNVKWAEEAVTKSESLSADEALKMNVINVIAKDVSDLLQKINGMVVDVRGQSQRISSSDLTVQTIEPDWRTRFLAVITDPSVAYLLLIIGFYGIFFELLNPGFVAPGVIGAICLIVGLYALALLPINYAGLALLLLGIAFMIAEAFLPSFGIVGIGGVISFVMGSVFLIKVEYGGFGLPIYLIATVTVVTIIFLIVILNLALRSHKRPIVSGREQLIGKEAHVQVDREGRLWILIEGERWQCKCQQKLTTGQCVKIVRLEGLFLRVEPK